MNNRFKDFNKKELEVLEVLLSFGGMPIWEGADKIIKKLYLELNTEYNKNRSD